MPKFSEWLFGSKDKLKKVATGTEAQTQFGGQDLIQWLQGMLQEGGGFDLANQFDQNILGNGPEAFNQFSAPYLQEFEEQILPMIAERYAGGGALSSSGFGQAIGGATAGLQANLAKLFTDLQNQSANRQSGNFSNLSQLGLNYQPFAYNKQEGNGGFLNNLLSGVMNPVSSVLGNNIASGINSLFKSPKGGGIS